MIFKKGDLVTMRYDDHAVEAEVILASPNGVSLMLAFEAIVDTHVGMMPVLQEEDGTGYRSIATDLRVTLTARAP